MPPPRLTPAATAALSLATLGAALMAASPAAAAVVYTLGAGYGPAAKQYTYVAPGYVTAAAGPFAFDKCSVDTCIDVQFQPGTTGFFGPADRVISREVFVGSGIATYYDDFAPGALQTAGFHPVPVGGHHLSVAEVGDYAQGSVLYLFDSPVGVFTFLSPGALTGDTGPRTAASCLYTGDYTCGAVDFDFGAPGAEDIFSVALVDQTGSGFIAHLRFEGGAFAGPGTYGGANNTRLSVIALPGGFAPPAVGVPEPGAWALMIAGFALVGGVARARRRSWV